MADDPIRKYSEATESFNKAYSNIRSLGGIILDVAGYLNNHPYEITISNVPGGAPSRVLKSPRVYSLNADNWPNVEQIAEAIANLHKACENVKSVWASLSGTDKGLVNPPDTKEPK